MANHHKNHLGYGLKQAQHALHRQLENTLRPLGLTSAQYAVLEALKSKPDQTNADLAEAAFLTPQSMQGVLAKLEAAALVERRPDQLHGRRQLACLTPRGRALAAQAEDRVKPIEYALWDAALPMSSDELLIILERIRVAMDSFNCD